MAEIEELGGRQVEKDSTNSSVPPTQQSIAAQSALRTRSLREPSGRPSGGQKGHKGHELVKTDSPSRTEEHKVRICPHCDAVIPDDAEQVCTMTTQVIDIAGILVEPEVTEHRRYTAICPHCHKKANAKLPGSNSKKTSYGPKLQALVIYLSVVQSVTFDRIAETMRDVFCVKSFSEGTVKNILERNARKALPVYQCLVQKLLREADHIWNENGKHPPGTEVRKAFERRMGKLLDKDVGHYGKEFQKLQNGIILCKDFMFTFLDHEGVPPHNNSSEGAIRILKVKTKVAGGFRAQAGADEYACFHSIVETAKRNGASKFGTLYQLMIEDNPNSDFIERMIS